MLNKFLGAGVKQLLPYTRTLKIEYFEKVVYIIKIKNLPYEKPDKNSECILYPYAHGNKIDIEVRKHKSGPQIGKYRKLKGNKMLNTQTGEIKECNSHEFKNPKEIFKKFVMLNKMTDK